MGALSGDEIEFYILNRKKKGRLEGEVTQILKRSKSKYVGVIQLNKNFAFVVPDDKKMPVDIYVPLKKIKKQLFVFLRFLPETQKNIFI